MSSEYNGNLISKLNSSTDDEELGWVIEEILEIKDPVFLQPLLDALTRNITTSIAHYFIRPFGQIKSKIANQYLDRIMAIIYEKRANLVSWVLNAMASQDYFPPRAIEIANEQLGKFDDPYEKKRLQLDELDIGYILPFLKKAGEIDKKKQRLSELFFSNVVSREEKNIILNYLIRINPSETITELIDRYREIEDTDAELIVAKELVGWKGTLTEKLKDKIINNSAGRAADILKEERQKSAAIENKQRKSEVEQESVTYRNIKIVEEISDIRKKINDKSLMIEQIEFGLIPDNDLLITQIKTVNSENDLVSALIKLRSIIQAWSEKIKEHGLSSERIQEVIPGMPDDEKNLSLNALQLFLASRNISDENLFGLRKINRLLSLLAHPEGKSELLELLNELGLRTMYDSHDWAGIHSEVLKMYRNSLTNLDARLVI